MQKIIRKICRRNIMIFFYINFYHIHTIEKDLFMHVIYTYMFSSWERWS